MAPVSMGLSTKEASSLLKEYGYNELPSPTPPSKLAIFFRQFIHLMVFILLGAALVAGITGDFVDSAVILAIVVLNALLGFFQEVRAENALGALKQLTTPVSKVIRDNQLVSLYSKEIVPGDTVLLEAGDFVPADGILINATLLSTQESSLTGESLPVHKNNGDSVFMGTMVLTGKAHMSVLTTGIKTELGKIAALLETKNDKPTPLQVRLSDLGLKLIYGCLALIVIIFLLSLLRKTSMGEAILIAVSLAVAAIPEGLPTVVTLSLAIGARKMAHKKAIVRILPSVETLGCTSVICSDKTGTITLNQMRVQKTFLAPEFSEKELLEIATLCTTAHLGEKGVIGDPTEGAILLAAKGMGMEKWELEAKYPLVSEIPFDSERKMMSMTRQNTDGEITYYKGAPEAILDKDHPALKIATTFAKEALRVLAVSYQKEKDPPVFVGLIGMIDPPRPEVKKAIETCLLAGIQPVMITGDHKETAEAIGAQIGLESKRVATGDEIEGMSDSELKNCVREIFIYARMSAEQKLRVVKAWQSLNEIVAVTGDGVNDAPSIKQADIGIAMGNCGSDVAKEAAHMVITDDNFATIVNAIEEGRGIYDNILKFVSYLLSSNIAELIVVFLAMIINFKDPLGHSFIILSAIQILMINLISDGLPAVALILDPVDPGAMRREPRKLKESLLPPKLCLRLLIISLVFALATLTSAYLGSFQSASLAQTMAFTSLVVIELIHVQVIRSDYRGHNIWIPISIALSFLIQLIIIYAPPMQEIFGTVSLSLIDWGEIGIISLIACGLDFLLKKI
jgi:Ca2+-transporting ATPase